VERAPRCHRDNWHNVGRKGHYPPPQDGEPAQGEIISLPPSRVDQGFIGFGDLAKLFGGGADTPIGMVAAGE